MVARTYRPRRKYGLVGPTSVARVQPRTSKGITDLLLPQASVSWALTVPLRSQRHRPDRPIKERKKAKKRKPLKKKTKKSCPLLISLSRYSPPSFFPLFHWDSTDRPVRLFSRLRSRSLTELTRQIAPPTKNGHAPPPIESRKSSQSVNPCYVWTW